MTMGLMTDFETLVVLDTETTGISMRTDEIIELGAVRFHREGERYLEDGELSFLIQLPTGRTVPPMIERITGIRFAAETESDRKFVVCNGDEGDPGAFMDRSILEQPNRTLRARSGLTIPADNLPGRPVRTVSGCNVRMACSNAR